jgi:WD40 repeat protein
MNQTPFKFLDSYTKDDKDIFFGREREVEELYHRVFEGKIMLVYGVSGTGKSSLIHCGLANKFQDADWLPVNIRRAGDMVGSMAFAINQVAITPVEGEMKTPAQFKKAVRSLYLDHYKPVFFIFDQFEELFIFGNKEEKKEFIQIVKALTDGDLQCRFMFVLREEYLAGITEFEKVIPTILANRVRIERMTLANAKQVIEGPCKVFGIEVEEGFSDEMLEKLSLGSAEVELTYLQVYLDKVYRTASFYSLVIASEERAKQPERSGARRSQSVQDEKIASQSALAMTFSKKILGELGEVKDLLGSFLDEQIELLPDPDSALAVLKSFVSVKGTKRQMSPEEVQDYAQTLGKPLSESALQELLQTLIQLRILRDKDQNNRYELRHDALATKIYEKITLVEKELLEIRHLIENAFHNWQKRGVLISAEDLGYIAPYENRLYLSKELEELIEKSKYALVKAKKRRRTVAFAALITLLVVFAGFTWWALNERNKAFAESKRSKVLMLVAKAQKMTNTDPTMAIRYAQLAYQYDSTNTMANQSLFDLYHNANANPFYITTFYDKDIIHAASFSPNGQTIVTISWGGTAKLWDLLGNCLVALTDHNDNINSANFSPDGLKVFTTGDKTAKLWDLNGNCLAIFTGHSGPIYRSNFSSDGQTVLTASQDGTAKLWDIMGNCLVTLSGHLGWVNSATFSPDGQNVLTASFDGTAKLWDLMGNCLVTLSGHSGWINSATFSPDGQTVLTASFDGTAKLWDLMGNCIVTLSGHSGMIHIATFSPDGLNVLTASDDKTAKLWDLKGNCLVTFTGHSNTIWYAIFSSDGQTVLTASGDNTSKLWDLKSNCLATLIGHNNRIRAATFSPDGQTVLTVSEDGTTKLWNNKGNCIATISDHSGSGFSPDGQTRLTASNDNTLKIWDLMGNCLATISGHSGWISSATFSPDGLNILSASGDKTAKLWDLKGNCLVTFTGHSNWIRSAVFSPDGLCILTASEDKTAKFWDLKGNCLVTFKGHSNQISSAAFSPDGLNILTASGDNTAKLWDLKGNCLVTFAGHSNWICSAAFSPDGLNILTASGDNTAKLWDMYGNCLITFKGHSDRLYFATFSPDGQNVLTGSYDNSVRLWDIKGGCLAIITNSNKSYFSPDGSMIHAVLTDGTEKQYQLPSSIYKWLKTAPVAELSVSDRAEVGELHKFMDVMVSENQRLIVEYAEYYYSINNFENSEKLYNRLIQLNSKTPGKRVLASFYLNQNRRKDYDRLYSDEPETIIKDEIFVFRDTSAEDNFRGKYLHYAKLSEFYEKLIKIEPTELNKREAAINYNYFGWYGILAQEFDDALVAIIRGIEINPFEINLQKSMPLCYLLTNQFEKSKELYLEYKNKPYENFTFKKAFLQDFSALESKGITHPDFEKIKNLLVEE